MEARLEALSLAFWLEVMADLAEGDEEVRLWLDTGMEQTGFLWWCEVTNKQAQEWRTSLLGLWALRGTQKGKYALKRMRDAAL